jgi:hypothetical protein
MRKIDILNFITDFRKTPNAIKTFDELRSTFAVDELQLQAMLSDLIQLRTIRETEQDGQKAYQVVAK